MELPKDPAIGREVDGYRIEAVLGRGGMGVVYKAVDVALSRPVAIKRINPGRRHHDESFLRRFRSEAQALARLNSPHITGIYALRNTELGPIIIMEYVEGGTLGDLLRRGPMEAAAVPPILDQMLQALEDAHKTGLLHRDIKPSNVLLTPSQTVKLTDFGLARALQRDTRITLTQGTAGTLNYMSPEQVQGQNDLGPSSDLFSLGMTAYEMLAGRLPFDRDGSEFAKMQAIVKEPFAPPNQFREEAPDELVQIVMKALRKSPSQRYRSAGAMREALTAASSVARAKSPKAAAVSFPGSSSGPAGTATGTAEKAQPSEASPQRRRSWAGALVSALALVLAAAGGYWLWTSGLPEVSLASRETAGTAQSDGAGSASASSGDTPLTGHAAAASGSSLAVRGRKPGYAPADTLLQPRTGQSMASSPAAPSEGAPPGATFSEESKEEAPPQDDAEDAPEDAPEVIAEHEAPDAPPPELQTSPSPSSASVSPPPRERSPRTEADEPATLTVSVEPTGSVEWNGERHTGSGTFEIPPGWQTLRLHHPKYETEEERLQLAPGQSEIRVFYFERVVRIKTDGPPGQIIVDGREMGATTPSELRLAPGRHKIRVRVPDYTVSGGEIISYGAARKRLIEFGRGNAKLLFIRPAFREKAYEMVFQTHEK